ncbi:MAG: serine--tRNA ligase [Elusimicrobia bacterium]|nr:serine--tRNA ligase [Candidatus Obscuribacterium magneticum]MCB4756354.1 serine--tRNA ligase [Candidatus Obscuribacterium magneticum]
MLDIKLIRDNPDLVRKGLQDRGGRYLPDLEKAIQKDKEWRQLVTELDQLRAKRNANADAVGKLKKEKKDASLLLKEIEGVKAQLKEKEEKETAFTKDLEELLLGLPNLPDKSVPLGQGPKENKVVREGGKKVTPPFTPKDHHDLGTSLGILDFETGAKLSGARFALLRGDGARLERAIANFMIDLHTKEHGYTEIQPPYLVSANTMKNTGQLPKFEEELYKCKDDDLYLIPTSEVSLANLLQEKTVDEKELPLAVTALTPCFRREAGSYGKDVRGLIRNHQFDKVELVRFCRMEDSLKELELLTKHAEEVLKRLELPYRVVALCTADLGFASAKTYDLEVWMPGEKAWREISSCSTCGDFQARRMNFKVVKDKKREFGCTLNGSGLAVGRTLAAVLENGQQPDGSINIPKALHPFFGGAQIPPLPTKKSL